jgi:hypothetical protein
MRYRWLAVYPVVYAALFVLFAWALVSGDALGPFVRWQLLLLRVLAIAGCWAAATAFDRGDHLRRAWMLLVWATVLVLVRDLLRFPVEWVANEGTGRWLIATLGVLSNVALLSGTWLLARAWKVAAIPLPGGRRRAIVVTLVVAAVAVAAAGPFAWRYLQTILAGEWGNLVMLVSAVVDILALCLIAPLLLTTLALRGGIVSWPWGLVTASLACWLLYDVAAGLQGSVLPGFPLTDVFRGLAENYLFAAGLAQRFVVRRVKKDVLDQTIVGMRSPLAPPTA